MSIDRLFRILSCGGVVLLAAMAGNADAALAQRTFVASTGADTNSCSLAAPCRSFAAAMAQTAANGEVIVLDSAGYGPVAITQNVAIIAPPGIYAGISVPTGTGISINSALVVLEGLTINGIGGTTGVSVANDSELNLTNCSITNFTTGLDVNASRAFVHDTEVRDNSGVGISVAGTGSLAILNKLRMAGNGVAVQTDGGSVSIVGSALVGGTTGVKVGVHGGTTDYATVHDSVIAEMSADGIAVTASGAGATSYADVLASTITRNTANGVSVTTASGASATVVVADSQLTQNGYAIQSDLGAGTSTTLSNRNLIAGNTLGGLKAVAAGTIHTRGNNSGEQVNPASGASLVAGF